MYGRCGLRTAPALFLLRVVWLRVFEPLIDKIQNTRVRLYKNEIVAKSMRKIRLVYSFLKIDYYNI